MKKNLLEVNGDLFEEYLYSIADFFGVEVKNNTVNIPASSGNGLIKYLKLEEGFGIRYFDFILKEDLELNFFYHDSLETKYRILYLLRDDSESEIPNKGFIKLYPNQIEFKGIVKRGQRFCRTVLLFNTTWLVNNYEKANVCINHIVESFVLTNKSQIVSMEFDHKSYLLHSQLTMGLMGNSQPMITVKMNSITLIYEFLNKVMGMDNEKILFKESSHYETMLKVEKKLMDLLPKLIPNVQELATEFNLSPSTLQRHFKLVFSKTIYDYYQEKRMILGKNEIENGDRSISQVAYKLGYNKVNNFSKAFKKQFHILPKELKFGKISI